MASAGDCEECQEESQAESMEEKSLCTPVRHKKVLKKVLRKVKKDPSRSIKKRMMNSFTRNASVTSSVQKQSLRANNKALAIKLEGTRQELRMTQEALLTLRKENRELEIKLASLQRTAGLRDEEIETEVEMRLEKNLVAVRDILSNVGNNIYDASQNLTSALNLCLAPSRRSRSSSRPTSTGSNSAYPSDGETDTYKRPAFTFPRTSLNFLEDHEASGNNIFRKANLSNDLGMSMIAEQSILVENTVPLSSLYPHDEDNSSKKENESMSSETFSKKEQRPKKRPVSKLPQRVPVKNKQHKDSVSDYNSSSDEAESGKQTDQSQANAVTNVDKTCVSNQRDTEVNRRKTFVVPSLSKEKQTEKLPQVTVKDRPAEKSPQGTIKDRRGTFVISQSEKSSQDTNKDRRGTFVVPQTETNNENEEEEQTIYFNSEMEMTEVISQQISIFSDSKDKSQEKGESMDLEESDKSSKSCHGENLLQKWEKFKSSRNLGIKDTDTAKRNNSADNSESDTSSKSAVEFRLPKPGKIVFAASRKQIDGTRKPVPLNVTKKPRSKSTVKLTKGKKATEPMKTPSKPSSVFDFSDQTPKISSNPPHSVYDLSLNESVQRADVKGNQKSEVNDVKKNNKRKSEKATTEESRIETEDSEISDKLKNETSSKGKGSQSKENAKANSACETVEATTVQSPKTKPNCNLLSDSPAYYLPLKGDSPEDDKRRGKAKSYKQFVADSSGDESTKIKPRTRSRSRKRTKVIDDSEDEMLNTRRGRSRSKVKQSHQDNNNDTEDEEVCVKRNSRGRSRSRVKRTNQEDDNVEDEEVCVGRKSRGRSRSRVKRSNQEDDNIEDEEVCVRSISRGRSRSRVKQTNQEDDNIEEVCVTRESRGRSRSRVQQSNQDNDIEDEDVCVTIKSRGRSRSRVQQSTKEHNNEDEDMCVRFRSRSRARTTKRNNDLNTESATGAKNESAEDKDAKSKEESSKKDMTPEIKCDEQKARSKTEIGRNNDREIQVEEDINKKVTQNENKEALENNEAPKVKFPRSKSRRRSLRNMEMENLDQRKMSPQSEIKHKNLPGQDKSGKTTKSDKETLDSVVNNIDQSKSAKETADIPKVTSTDEVGAEQDSKLSGSEKTKDLVNVTKRSRSSKYVPTPDIDDDITFSDFDKFYKKVQQHNLEQDQMAKSETHDETKQNTCPNEESKSFKTPAKPGDSDNKSKKIRKSSKKRRRSSTSTDLDNQEKENVKSSSTRKEVKPVDKTSHPDLNINDTKAKLLSLQKRLTMAKESEISHGSVLESKENFKTPRVSTDRTSIQSDMCSPDLDGSTNEPDGKRSRRAASKVSYKELPINCKLRRGDAVFGTT